MKVWQRKRIIQAFELAIDYTVALIDAHTTKLVIEKGVPIYKVPSLNKAFVNKWKRDIKAFRKIRQTLKEGEDG